ncbi:MAG TPA: hypoxanthine phosphoribosyltransferase [Gemmatimonadota bacterium]|jgi:hypoxanthine phosphoribosyltransferase|nr:hypoxanthine phosphoribosyltransferase [Gemmatimonadota bacterium]
MAEVGATLTDERTEVLIPERELQARVRELGAEIAADYRDRDLVLLCLLKGGIYFAADLSRAIDLPITLEFVRARSYAGTESSGEVQLWWIDGLDIAGKDVLVVEDIVDTGLTLVEIWRALERKGPASLELCALLYKEKFLAHPFSIRYIGFAIGDAFVVGYGLDYEERYRNLPHIAVFHPARPRD